MCQRAYSFGDSLACLGRLVERKVITNLERSTVQPEVPEIDGIDGVIIIQDGPADEVHQDAGQAVPLYPIVHELLDDDDTADEAWVSVDTWPCTHCTFENMPMHLTCKMCDQNRF